MITWCRTADGWAANLDGSDAAQVCSLPRVEVRSTSAGWQSECLLADGTRSRVGAPYLGGLVAAKASALAQAARLLPPQHPALIRSLG